MTSTVNASVDVGGGGYLEGTEAWVTESASDVPYLPGWPAVRAMDDASLQRVRTAFAEAARVCFRDLFLRSQPELLEPVPHLNLAPLRNALTRLDRWT